MELGDGERDKVEKISSRGKYELRPRARTGK